MTVATIAEKKSQFSESPSRSERAPETIAHGFAHTSLGLALVASTTNGLRAVLFGSNRDRLLSDLRTRFPSANLQPGNAAHQEVVDRIGAFINDPRKTLDVKLDFVGSALEQQVWNSLRTIPVGTTRSYSEIAKSLPGTVTAQDVAGACSANPLAVVVPCHRVIRKDGSLSGYRWGAKRKQDLLAKERLFLSETVAPYAAKPREQQLLPFVTSNNY